MLTRLLLYSLICPLDAFVTLVSCGMCHGIFFFAVVLANHEVTDDDVEPTLKRQRIEINCQDPSIKVTIKSFSILIQTTN